MIDVCKNLHKHSLYFLLGPETNHKSRLLYIGQTQDASVRLKQHDSKQWWTTAIVLTRNDKDSEFDRTTIQYLEYQSIKEVIEHQTCQLMQNCQIPSEPYTENKDEIIETFNHIKILIRFAGFMLFEHKVYSLDECYQYSKKNNIANRLANRIVKEMCNRSTEYEEDFDSEMVSYILSSGDNNFYAEAIPLNDGTYMILPVSKIDILNGDKELLSIINSNDSVFDWLTGNLKSDIICDSLEDAARIICNDKSMKWQKNVKRI